MGFHDEYMKRLFYKELTGPPKTVTQGLIHGMADRDSRQRQINHSPSNYDNADAGSFVLDKVAVFKALGLSLVAFLVGLTLCIVYAGSALGYIGVILAVFCCILILTFVCLLMGHAFFALLGGFLHIARQKWFIYTFIVLCLIGVPGLLRSSGGFGALIFGVLAALAFYGIYRQRKHDRGGDDDDKAL